MLAEGPRPRGAQGGGAVQAWGEGAGRSWWQAAGRRRRPYIGAAAPVGKGGAQRALYLGFDLRDLR